MLSGSALPRADAPCVLIIGDSLLDIDIVGSVRRLAPDAPVPVLEDSSSITELGGAARVAKSVRLLGATPTLIAPLGLGEDDAVFARLLSESGVNAIVFPTEAGIARKTRYRAGATTLLRSGTTSSYEGIEIPSERISSAIGRSHAIVVADYGCGLLENQAIRSILANCASRIPIIWDPRENGSEPVEGCWIVKPNVREAASALSRSLSGMVAGPQVHDLARDLARKWRTSGVVITQGQDGASLYDDERGVSETFRGQRHPHADPRGAGDHFAAALAVAASAGHTRSFAVQQACERTAEHLRAIDATVEAMNRRACEVSEASRAKGLSVAVAGGCFDALHYGHLKLLIAAKSLADSLIVCINSDRSVKRLKGKSRPFHTELQRARMLLELRCVDAVYVFEEDDPSQALDALRPTVFVKGDEYSGRLLRESDALDRIGASVHFVESQPRLSSTRIVDQFVFPGQSE